MQRYLFELCAFLGNSGVERRSPWVSDEWLENELQRDPNLDRLVEVSEGAWHPLPTGGERRSTTSEMANALLEECKAIAEDLRTTGWVGSSPAKE